MTHRTGAKGGKKNAVKREKGIGLCAFFSLKGGKWLQPRTGKKKKKKRGGEAFCLNACRREGGGKKDASPRCCKGLAGKKKKGEEPLSFLRSRKKMRPEFAKKEEKKIKIDELSAYLSERREGPSLLSLIWPSEGRKNGTSACAGKAEEPGGEKKKGGGGRLLFSRREKVFPS